MLMCIFKVDWSLWKIGFYKHANWVILLDVYRKYVILHVLYLESKEQNMTGHYNTAWEQVAISYCFLISTIPWHTCSDVLCLWSVCGRQRTLALSSCMACLLLYASLGREKIVKCFGHSFMTVCNEFIKRELEINSLSLTHTKRCFLRPLIIRMSHLS